jgi:hypothetical protein
MVLGVQHVQKHRSVLAERDLSRLFVSCGHPACAGYRQRMPEVLDRGQHAREELIRNRNLL